MVKQHIYPYDRLSDAEFTGGNTDIQAVSNFLLKTRQDARLRPHLQMQTFPLFTPIKLTRILNELHLPPPVRSATVASAMQRTFVAQVSAQTRHPSNKTNLPSTGLMLSTTEDAKLIRNIPDILRAEQHTLEGLLLTTFASRHICSAWRGRILQPACTTSLTAAICLVLGVVSRYNKKQNS